MSEYLALARKVLDRLRRLPSRQLTIPAAFVLGAAWGYYFLAPDDWVRLPFLDVALITLSVSCLTALLDLTVFRSHGLVLAAATAVAPRFKWFGWLLSLTLPLVFLSLAILVLRRHYLPPVASGSVLVLDSALAPGDSDSSNLVSVIARSLISDSCALNTDMHRVATPLPAFFGESWVALQRSRLRTGILVYGEPAQRPTAVCAAPIYGDRWPLLAPIYAEWPGEFSAMTPSGTKRRKFIWDVPYCQAAANTVEIVDEVIWQSHILLSLKRASHRDSWGAAVAASHGAMGGRSKRRFRSIVSSYASGLAWLGAAKERLAQERCTALPDLDVALRALLDSIHLSHEVERGLAAAEKEAPSFRELYNNANMAWANIYYFEYLPKLRDLQTSCTSSRDQ